jgi:hypothetical protein
MKTPYTKPMISRLGSIKQVVSTNTRGEQRDSTLPAEQCSIFIPSPGPADGGPPGTFIPGCLAS